MQTEIKDLTTFGSIVNSGFSSVCNITIVHPLFSLKTHRMTTGKFPPFSLPLLYRGYGANICCDLSCQTVNFIANNFFANSLMHSKSMNVQQQALGGIFSGCMATPLLNFVERVMILKQIGFGNHQTGQLYTTKKIILAIWEIEGWRGFIKGGIPTLFREGISSACFFGLSKALEPSVKEVIPFELLASFISFFLSGAISGSVTTSFDLVKTRMQSVVGQNRSFITVAIEIIKKMDINIYYS